MSVPVKVRRLSRSGSMVTEAPPPTPTPSPVEEVEEVEEEEEEDFLADLKSSKPETSSSPKHINEDEAIMPPADSFEQYVNPEPLPPDHPLLSHLGKPKATRKGGKQSNNVFSSTPTPILGDKRNALMKIQQYKALFPDIPQVKAFKVKPTATEAELEAALAELETIASCSTLQTMCDEMVLACVRVVENVTAKTNGTFDITGTAEMLKLNPDFHRLCRVLTIKYSVFANVPPETQLLMIIMSTAMVCVQKNRAGHEIRNVLNQPY